MILLLVAIQLCLRVLGTGFIFFRSRKLVDGARALGSSLQLPWQEAGCWCPVLNNRTHFIFRTWCRFILFIYEFYKLQKLSMGLPSAVSSRVAWLARTHVLCRAGWCIVLRKPKGQNPHLSGTFISRGKKRKPSFHFLLTLGKWASCPGRNEMNDGCGECLCWVMELGFCSPPRLCVQPEAAQGPLLLI